MPVTYYTSDEYLSLLNKYKESLNKIDTLEKLRPLWAQGFTSDSAAAQSWANATKQLWDLLGATDQTSATLKLRGLLADY